MNGTLFFVLGIGLATLAVFTSLVGLRTPRFPSSRAAMVATIAIFVAIVGGVTTFAVLHAKDEQKAKAAELNRGGEQAVRGESQ